MDIYSLQYKKRRSSLWERKESDLFVRDSSRTTIDLRTHCSLSLSQSQFLNIKKTGLLSSFSLADALSLLTVAARCLEAVPERCPKTCSEELLLLKSYEEDSSSSSLQPWMQNVLLKLLPLMKLLNLLLMLLFSKPLLLASVFLIPVFFMPAQP